VARETPKSRDIPLDTASSALLFIDVQNFCVRRDGGEFKGLSDDEIAERYGYYFERLATVIPNMQRLQAAFRSAGVEILYTTIESLTKDGRDRSLDYKITGFLVPKGSWDGKVIEEIAPTGDEIVLPKGSSSVFVSTNIDYLLRNLGVRQLVISGLVTDQCVESAVRDACDLGYLVTLVTDACAAYSAERQDDSLRAIKGYCRQVTTGALIEEVARPAKLGDADGPRQQGAGLDLATAAPQGKRSGR
jgi:ureidoacrylate peracid hydrolase